VCMISATRIRQRSASHLSRVHDECYEAVQWGDKDATGNVQ